jgi:glycosyltransferase involved in cell wall biosynthesis
MKKVLLISNRVMHYRVSIYNYFYERFNEEGWEFVVRANELQRQNPYPLKFDFKEVAFSFEKYMKEIKEIRPDCVIIFLHLKDFVYWPLAHWLKLNKIPFIYWNKARNYDDPDNKIRNFLFHYMQTISDGILLYSESERVHIHNRNKKKVFVASNTINYKDFPEIKESKEEIKNELDIPFEKVVLAVGRMGIGGGRKKIDQLIEIFREIDLDGVGLVLVGSGMNEKLKQRINSENTLYLGEIHDPANIQISKIFKLADVFSIPGHIGLGLNQAFFWGLPVVTMDGDQPPEINYLENGRNGFLVSENDTENLKNKIIMLLKDDVLRYKFSINAHEDLLRKASIDNMLAGFRGCIHFAVSKV